MSYSTASSFILCFCQPTVLFIGLLADGCIKLPHYRKLLRHHLNRSIRSIQIVFVLNMSFSNITSHRHNALSFLCSRRQETLKSWPPLTEDLTFERSIRMREEVHEVVEEECLPQSLQVLLPEVPLRAAGDLRQPRRLSLLRLPPDPRQPPQVPLNHCRINSVYVVVLALTRLNEQTACNKPLNLVIPLLA
ncbi:hypothetical protein SAY87_020814 [Trapa incisa]|uniref:Uncharacterized protein n=1 Tax=Trapa incisa TaxID=236973 RepID=A0AAN7JQY9_9MYRT|nr:hypothetical protein SAY87_020814 [Trapa incisa]